MSDVFGCDLWTGPRDKDGYGIVGRKRTHIVAWVEANGPIEEGLVLDHLCRRRNCRALHHLEPVTQSENEKRKIFKYRAKRKACSRGHDLHANRIVTPEGGVVCRICNRESRSRMHITDQRHPPQGDTSA